MPLRQGETVPQMVVRIAREQGLDARATKIALAIVAQESAFNAQAEGDWSDAKGRMRSIGLFQLNEEGLGSGMGDSRYDPEANANRGIANLKAVLAKHGALSDGDVAYLAQRPADKGAYVTSINAKTNGSDKKWAGTIDGAMRNVAGGGSGGEGGANNSQPVFPIAGKTLANTVVTTQHGAKGTNTGYGGVPESHRGMDLSANRGAQVVSPVSGVVAVAHQWDGTKNDPYGNYIDVRGDDGKTYRVAHLQELSVKQGAKIGQATLLGTVDSTGNSSGDHLHFEEIVNGQAVNPMQTLAGGGSVAGGTRMAGDTTKASALVTALDQQVKEQAEKVKQATAQRDSRQSQIVFNNQEIARIRAKPSRDRTPAENAAAASSGAGSLSAKNTALTAEIADLEPKISDYEKILGELQKGLASARDQAAGKELDPSQVEQNEAQAAQARAQAAKLEKEAAQSGDPNSPDNQHKLAQAALYRKQADNYDASTAADNALKGAQATSALGSAAQSNAQAAFLTGTLESTVRQHLAAAGLNDAQTKVAMAKLQPEINAIVATTAKTKDDASYIRAMTEAVNKKLPGEIAKVAAEAGLIGAQATDLVAKLPGALVLQGTQARLDQAQAGAQSGAALTSLATANKTNFDMQMDAWKAQRMQELSKLASKPGVTANDISGFLMGSATNAQEAINAFNAEIERQGKQEASRSSKVKESIDIQNADETMRNNLANNVTSYMNARANQQNASTTAMGPMLGAPRDFNALAGMGPLAGAGEQGLDAIRSIANSMGVGESVLGGVINGLKEYQGTIKGFKDQMPNVRMANPNAVGTEFKPPSMAGIAAAGASAAGGPPVPTPPSLVLPKSLAELQQQSQQALPTPEAAAAPAPTPAAVAPGNTPPDQMDSTGNDLPQQPVDQPPPEEEEGQGGGGGGGGGSFRPPKRKKPARMEKLKAQFGMFRAPMGQKMAGVAA